MMEIKINHKRYLRTIHSYRTRRSQLATLKAIGYYEFIKEWDHHLTLSLSGIRDAVSEDHCNDLLEIRNRAAELYLHCAYFFTRNPEDYDEHHFFTEIKKLLEEHTKITTEYKIEDDINFNGPLTAHISAYNDAAFMMSKPSMKEKFPSMRDYIKSSLQYFKTKNTYQSAPDKTTEEIVKLKNFADLFEKPYNQPDHIEAFVRILKMVDPALIDENNHWLSKSSNNINPTAARVFYEAMVDNGIIKRKLQSSVVGKIFSKYFKGFKATGITNTQPISDKIHQLYNAIGPSNIADRVKNAKEKIDQQVINN